MKPGHDIHALRAAGATYREIRQITGLSLSQINYRLNATQRAAVPPASTVKPRRRSVQQERKCMTCQQPFPSEGPHNRMCGRCRRQGASPFDTPAIVHHR